MTSAAPYRGMNFIVFPKFELLMQAVILPIVQTVLFEPREMIDGEREGSKL